MNQVTEPDPCPPRGQLTWLLIRRDRRNGLVLLDRARSNERGAFASDSPQQLAGWLIIRILSHHLALYRKRQDQFPQPRHTARRSRQQFKVLNQLRLRRSEIPCAWLSRFQHSTHARAPSDAARMVFNWSRSPCTSPCSRA